MIGTSARYMRRSAAISVRMGTTLDDGARRMKNHELRKAIHSQLRGARNQATTVATPTTVSANNPSAPPMP